MGGGFGESADFLSKTEADQGVRPTHHRPGIISRELPLPI